MVTLLSTIKNTFNENSDQPFSVYTSIKEQKLLNVPIAKPLLIVVLSGNKELGLDKCGYQSQSRFTERFKRRFGLTPSELRKTKMTD